MKLQVMFKSMLLFFLMLIMTSHCTAQKSKTPGDFNFEKIEKQIQELQRQLLENFDHDEVFKNFDTWKDESGKGFLFRFDTTFSWRSDGLSPFDDKNIDSLLRAPGQFFQRFFDLSPSPDMWKTLPPPDIELDDDELLPEEKLRLQEQHPEPSPPTAPRKNSAESRKKTVRI